MTLFVCLLTFTGVSLAIAVGFSFVASRMPGDANRMSARVEEEFTQAETVAVSSPLFKSLDATALRTDLSLADFSFESTVVSRNGRTLRSRLEKMLERSDLSISFQTIVNASGICGVVLGLAASVAAGLLAGLACGVVGLMLPWLWVRFHYCRRRDRLFAQLPGAFELMARVLRSGQSVPQALLAVADSMEAPISKEFAFCQKQQHLGMTPEVSYAQMADRAGILELKIFVMAMAIQRQFGGNLSDVLDRLSNLIRERQELSNHVRTLTAEGRLQGLTLLVLPFIVFGAILCVNRSYGMTLFDHMSLLVGTGISMTIGMLWIRRIIDIDY
jgi:tight adherence protein B